MIFSFLLYAVTLTHDYNVDDELVTKGHRLTSQGVAAIPEIFQSPYYQDDMGYSYEYRPITHVSFAIEHWLLGEHPGVSHCINVLLYSFTVLLVFLTTRMMGSMESLHFPVIAALLFAVHPMHTETIASIKNRDELLAFLFGIGALYNTIGFLDRGGALRWLAVVILLILSLLSKTSGAVFLLLVPACFLLRKDAPSLRMLFVFLTALVPLGLLSTLLDVPPHLLKYGGFTLIAMSTILLLWHVTRKINVDHAVAIFRQFKPTGWPEAKSKNSLIIQPLGHQDLFTALLITVLIALSYSAELPLIQVWVLLALVTAPYWKGQYRLGTLILIAGHCLQLSLMESTPNRSMGTLLLLLVPLIYLDNNQRFDRIFLGLLIAYLLPFVVTEYRLLSPSSLLDHLWVLIALIGPVTKLILTLVLRKRFNRVIQVLWSISCVVLLIDFVFDPVETTFIILAGDSLFLLFLIGKWPKGAIRPQHLLAIILASSAFLTPQNPYFHRLKDKITGNATMVDVSIAPSNTVVLSKSSEKKRNDRPLDYVEYPLGVDATFSEKLGTSSVIMGQYLRKMFIPWPQAFYYGYNEVPLSDIRTPWAIICSLIHAALLILALYCVRKHPLLSFGLLAYLASVLMVSNFLIPIAGMMGDRLSYIASFGFCISLAYALAIIHEKLNNSFSRSLLMVTITITLATWSTMTIARTVVWKDALTLMRHDIGVVNNSAQAHFMLASQLMTHSYSAQSSEAGLLRKEALVHFKASLTIYPEYFNAWYYMGRACMVSNNLKCAISAFKEVNRLDSTLFEAPFNVAVISNHVNDAKTSVEYFKRCITIDPNRIEPYQALADLYIKNQQFLDAVSISNQALRIHPEWRWAEENKQFAQSLLDQGEGSSGSEDE